MAIVMGIDFLIALDGMVLPCKIRFPIIQGIFIDSSVVVNIPDSKRLSGIVITQTLQPINPLQRLTRSQ